MWFTMFVLGTFTGLVVGTAFALRHLRSARRGLSAEMHKDLHAEFRRIDEQLNYLEEAVGAALRNRGEIINQFAELNARYHQLAAMSGPDRKTS